jgi:hypothetical protein
VNGVGNCRPVQAPQEARCEPAAGRTAAVIWCPGIWQKNALMDQATVRTAHITDVSAAGCPNASSAHLPVTE